MARRLLTGLVPVMLVWLSPAGHAQSRWNGPVEGFVFDPPTRSVRPVVGLLGAAYLGQAALEGLDTAWIAPGGQYGIGVRDQQVLLMSALSSENPGVSALDGANLPDGVVWSADGSSAVLYSAVNGWIQKLTNLPGRPVAGVAMDLSSLGGTISAVAVDMPAERVAIGIRKDSGGGVYIAADDQVPVLRKPMLDPSALAFSQGSGILYAADRATGQIFELRDSSDTLILSVDGSAADLAAIRAGEDSQGRKVLYAAGRADRTIRVYDAATYATLDQIALDVEPAGLDAFGEADFVIAVRVRDGDAAWFLRAKPAAGVYFVPAALVSSGGQP